MRCYTLDTSRLEMLTQGISVGSSGSRTYISLANLCSNTKVLGVEVKPDMYPRFVEGPRFDRLLVECDLTLVSVEDNSAKVPLAQLSSHLGFIVKVSPGSLPESAYSLTSKKEGRIQGARTWYTPIVLPDYLRNPMHDIDLCSNDIVLERLVVVLPGSGCFVNPPFAMHEAKKRGTPERDQPPFVLHCTLEGQLVIVPWHRFYDEYYEATKQLVALEASLSA